MTNLDVRDYRARCTSCHNIVKIAGDDTGSIMCPCGETNLHVKPTHYGIITQECNMIEDLTIKTGYCPNCDADKDSNPGAEYCETCGHDLYNPEDLD